MLDRSLLALFHPVFSGQINVEFFISLVFFLPHHFDRIVPFNNERMRFVTPNTNVVFLIVFLFLFCLKGMTYTILPDLLIWHEVNTCY